MSLIVLHIFTHIYPKQLRVNVITLKGIEKSSSGNNVTNGEFKIIYLFKLSKRYPTITIEAMISYPPIPTGLYSSKFKSLLSNLTSILNIE